MNVIELLELANWYSWYFKKLNSLYGALHSVLTQNVSQPTQQPIEEHLKALHIFLSDMGTEELSLQQLKLLNDLSVEGLIGKIGAEYIEKTVKTASYDPASTEQKVQAAIQKLSEANQKLHAYSVAINNLGIEPDTFDNIKGRIIVRIGFRDAASINNIVDWKTSSEDWHHIIRGVAMVAGEAPEETKVIGATKGSLILILATTAAVTAILAIISKHIATIAKEMYSIGEAREKLKQMQLYTDGMAREFEKSEKNKKGKFLDALHKDLKKKLPANVPGDTTTALEKSIEKLLKFGENGGDIDFVSPLVEETEADDAEAGSADAPATVMDEMKEVRQIIQDYQGEREAVRLLENNARR